MAVMRRAPKFKSVPTKKKLSGKIVFAGAKSGKLAHGSVKGDRLVARVSSADKSLITKAAAISGQSVGSFVLVQARKAAVQTIEAIERIVLNVEQSRRFVDALLAPPREPPRRMIEAMELHRRTVKSDA